MSDEEDTKALDLLEKAVYKAQESVLKLQSFQPFLLLLTDEGKIESYENKIEDSLESYANLEEVLTQRMQKDDIAVMALVMDDSVPASFSAGFPSAIRLHIEEKSQKDKKIGARFLYVPYTLCKGNTAEVSVTLHTPIPVGFPAEYIV